MGPDSSLFNRPIHEIMIPANRVAFVNQENSLEHGLLVLTKSGYSAIPVLDWESRVKGIVNTTLIANAMIDPKGYNLDKLTDLTIAQVMLTGVPQIEGQDTFLRALELSINWPFLCVEDANQKFIGILTRKTILGLLYQHSRKAIR